MQSERLPDNLAGQREAAGTSDEAAACRAEDERKLWAMESWRRLGEGGQPRMTRTTGCGFGFFTEYMTVHVDHDARGLSWSVSHRGLPPHPPLVCSVDGGVSGSVHRPGSGHYASPVMKRTRARVVKHFERCT
ncbi:Os04g0589450 [Oryza sativa Japonica Group]|uniref:Os04g0589450 protein n=1 Tax=Oryza sativa subsp. japonica TaxID=39947 RepID=A0A0P0WE14_ORYSJ|nr:Os04g0589450 [Oryza sativa Japonica Group]